MTIHEAKGQEFPVVIVPGIGKQFQDKARISNGSVEFELVPSGENRTPVLGLKVPGKWGEESQATSMRQVAQARRRDEEHAEEKRILYVACTRAKDHLILTGQHKADDEEATGIEAPEPDDPTAMRDWIQPTLFGRDEDAVTSWETLAESGQFRRELTYEIDGRTKRGAIIVRCPPEEGSYDGESVTVKPKTQRSTYEYEQPWELQLSPSAMTGLVDGNQELVVDEERRQVRAESVDHGRSEENTGTESLEISTAVFGQAVHRLCEMRPPQSEWPGFIRQVCDEERSVGEDGENKKLTDDVLLSIETAAERAVNFLDELHASEEVQATYDEFPIELSIPQGELQGYIDHLVVTENAYHMVDYKTDRKPDDKSVDAFLQRRAKHHEPQVLAYAAALSAADPERDVRATLFFTDIDTRYSWGSEELTKGYERTLNLVRSELRGTNILE
jgi:ATP-dependent helicase/nuclease subunit A